MNRVIGHDEVVHDLYGHWVREDECGAAWCGARGRVRSWRAHEACEAAGSRRRVLPAHHCTQGEGMLYTPEPDEDRAVVKILTCKNVAPRSSGMLLGCDGGAEAAPRGAEAALSESANAGTAQAAAIGSTRNTRRTTETRRRRQDGAVETISLAGTKWQTRKTNIVHLSTQESLCYLITI